ncbi:Vomeronasal type-2 receptor 1 [Dissostichus eleginoides]|uniref:Vomeronasal type-2 receptor 1 n=1 Tax=Dissostichus eleginoides TaxID=100907 RepID=A0AAD9FI75_DISEL|nr:Vomeronasal type-2 receptor 1 [Dissostichus eleginoides]
MDGDYVIGGVFSIHSNMHTVKHNYTTMPEPLSCAGSINSRGLRFSRAMVFAIEQINNSTELLPGIKLGYEIYDSCASVSVAVHVAFQLSGGLDPVFNTGDKCSESGMVMAVVGASASTSSISMSRIIGPFNIPQVVLAFTSIGDMRILLEELSRKPSPPRQWIGSESWVTDRDMLRFSFLAGAIGFGIEKSVIPGLRDFLLDLSPSKVADSPLLTMFWEEAFNCRLVKSEATDRSVCDGTEDIKTLQSSYTDTSQLRCDKFTKLEAKELQGTTRQPAFSMDGDYVIGGVFSIHSNMHTVKHNYTTMPEPLSCAGSIDSRELRFSRAMVFAIEQINNSTELLPGIKLGYEIYDSCASVPVSVHVAFQLSGGLDPVFNTGDKCSQSGMVMAVVGESGSTPSISMSRVIGPFNIPQVVVAFISPGDMKILLEELSRKPSPPRQWIGSEAWVTDPDMLRFSFLAGAIGFGIEKSVIPGLRDFLLDLSPSKVADSPLLTMFWEEAFNCRLVKSEATDRSVCDGTEDIKTLQSSYTDTSQLRITNMVYKAVYAIAHAIHNAVCQKTDSTTQCDKFTKLEAKEEFLINRNLTWVEGGTQVRSPKAII